MAKRLQILVIDDDTDILLTSKMILKDMFPFIRTEHNPHKIRSLISQDEIDIAILDMNFKAGTTSGEEGMFWLNEIKRLSPATEVIMITAYGDLKLAVRAMKQGATDFVLKPWENEKFIATVQATAKLAHSRKKIKSLKNENQALKSYLQSPSTKMIGQSKLLNELKSTIRKVGKTDASVLILGQNGTGKDLTARAIHNNSGRADKPFIHVDLGSLSHSLFESELFGYCKGAFTDAKKDHIGKIRLANEGTLFLDEVGNLDLSLQQKLLHVLQNKEITPLGSNDSFAVDFRLICATNTPKVQLQNEQLFRQDLYYRINTIELTIPTLKERKEDILLLFEHFNNIFSQKYNRPPVELTQTAKSKLKEYNWPGNIRELKHYIERLIILSDKSIVDSNNLPELQQLRDIEPADDELNIRVLEKRAIIKALHKHQGNLSEAAKELGLGRTTLYRKMEKYGL